MRATNFACGCTLVSTIMAIVLNFCSGNKVGTSDFGLILSLFWVFGAATFVIAFLNGHLKGKRD